MKKSKVIFSIVLISFFILIATITVILVSNKNSKNYGISKNKDIQLSQANEKKIYGTFKSDANWVKDPAEIDNVIAMANNYSIVKATIVSIGDANFLQSTAPVPYTPLIVEISEVLDGNSEIGTKTIYVEGGDIKISNLLKVLNDVEITKMGLDTLSNEDKENMYISYTSDYTFNLKENEEYIMILSNNNVSTIMASGYGIFKEEGKNNNSTVQSVNTHRSLINVITGKEFDYIKNGEKY